MKTKTHNAMQLVGVKGCRRVGGRFHLLGQVARAIEGVCVAPLIESLLAIKEEKLQC